MSIAVPPPGPVRRVAYLGTPSLAVAPLIALLDADIEVALVVSQPDRRRGRGSALVASPVRRAALDLGLPVTTRVEDVVDAGVPLGVVVAFGRIIQPAVLEVVPMVNLHFSLLPRWRGAAPVERAVLAGDAETGVCLMGLEEGLDTGPVYEVVTVPIDPVESVEALRARLVDIGTEVLVRRLADGPASLGTPVAQEGEPTYASKVDPVELALDWAEPAVTCLGRIRLGRAWTTFRGKRLLVHEAVPVPVGDDVPAPGEVAGLVVGCGDGEGLRLVRVQPEGKAAQPADAWRNGAQPKPGERLGEG